MRKPKKRVIIVITVLLLIIFIATQLYKWHKPYRVANDMFGIDVPLTAKATLFEHDYHFFDSSGETRIVFDVSKLKKEMKQLLAEKNFIRSDKDVVIIQTRRQLKIYFDDRDTGLSLGLKGGYYLPFYELTSAARRKIVVYNPAESTLILYNQKTR